MRMLSLAVAVLCFACGSDPTAAPPATPGVPTQLDVETGKDQTGVVHTALAVSIGVKVLDAKAQAVPEQLINWVVVKGGGSVFLIATNSDENGEAQNQWTLGDTAGTQSLEARVILDGVPTVIERIDATAQPGPTVVSRFRIHQVQIAEQDTVSILADGEDAFGNPTPGDTAVLIDGLGAYGHSLYQGFQFGRTRFTVPGDTMTVYIRPALSSLSGAYSNPSFPISYVESATMSWDSLSARDATAHDCSLSTQQTGPDWAAWGGVDFLARRADDPDSVQASTPYAYYAICVNLKASTPTWWTYYFYPDDLNGPVHSHLTQLQPLEIGQDSLVFSSGTAINDTLVLHR